MSNTKVSLNNLESIMKAAEAECESLRESENRDLPVSESNDVNSTNQMVAETETLGESENRDLPKIPPIAESNVVKEALNSTNISAMFNQMAANPDEVSRMMEESMNRVTPDMMEQARKVATGGQGQQIMREMQKRGLNPKAIKDQMIQQKRALRGLRGGKKTEETLQVILITAGRQAKVRMIPRDNITGAIGNILKCSSPVELSCSRLANGPLEGKIIKVWYNPEHEGKNRRATKIVGFPIGGEIVVVNVDENLTESSLIAAEQNLV